MLHFSSRVVLQKPP